MATECPRCGLINPPAARHCDCGYDLATRPALAERELGLRALFLSLDGRIGRATYWLKFLLPYAGVWIGLVYLDRTLGTFDRQTQLGLCSGIFLVVTLYPYIAVAVKRCHDRDRSGWFLFIGLVPILNLWLLVELGLLEGTVGQNKFGFPER